MFNRLLPEIKRKTEFALKRICFVFVMLCITTTGHAENGDNLPALDPKPYKVGIAPSHITVKNGPMLRSSKDWPKTAESIDIFKYYGVQLVDIKWATPVKPEDLVALAKREQAELGCEFGDFHLTDNPDETSIKMAFEQIDPIFKAGGKLSYLHLDGAIRRQLKGFQKAENARSLDDIAKGIATFCKRVRAKYPDLKIGLITNFPNWDFTKDLPGRNGHYTHRSGVTYLQALNAVEKALSDAGETLDFVEVDNPYNYYEQKRTKRNAPLDNAASILGLQRWCEKHNIPFHLVLNVEPGGSNAKFRDKTLEYIRQIRKDGIFPDLFIIQSWYKRPDAQLPESKQDTFTNTAKTAIDLIHKLYPAANKKGTVK